MVVKCRRLPRKVDGITLFGVVFVRRRYADDAVLLNHERIHCRQQLEWAYIPFYIIYLLEWLWHLVRLRDWQRAYRAISFEREAYEHQRDLDYLRRRPLWANLRRRHSPTTGGNKSGV